jgi:hypothetical protein
MLTAEGAGLRCHTRSQSSVPCSSTRGSSRRDGRAGSFCVDGPEQPQAHLACQTLRALLGAAGNADGLIDDDGRFVVDEVVAATGRLTIRRDSRHTVRLRLQSETPRFRADFIPWDGHHRCSRDERSRSVSEKRGGTEPIPVDSRAGTEHGSGFRAPEGRRSESH